MAIETLDLLPAGRGLIEGWRMDTVCVPALWRSPIALAAAAVLRSSSRRDWPRIFAQAWRTRPARRADANSALA